MNNLCHKKSDNDGKGSPIPLPNWLRVKTGKAKLCAQTRALLASHQLHTVCENAQCPNIGECYSRGTATFLLLGNVCTRNCRFCAVPHGRPEPPDPHEPQRIAEAAQKMGLKYVVLTSVTRDDLPDGGASHFAATMNTLRAAGICDIEVLTPDFQGNWAALQKVLDAYPTVFNHNIETVRELSPLIRPQAHYELSLEVLRQARQRAPEIRRKSGFMVGLGETEEQIVALIRDLCAAGCQILTIGQYLRPSRKQWPVQRYVPPEEFARYANIAREMGIPHVVAGPFVRSSYQAADVLAHYGNA